MKKNISINISGIIFHIEEDGFETLKSYLDSINKYFSSYEDSDEIIADIEGRIAEIFLEKLQEGNQVVSADDVTALIKTMGNISDFEAIEEEDDFEAATKAKTQEKTKGNDKSQSGQKTSDFKKPTKLYRDLQRRVLGGVASGIAHYYNFDPLWLRVGILFAIFGLFFLGAIGGTVFLAYIIMWIVTPGNEHLVEDKKIKKLYRDPEERVIGGVSAGLAKYFHTETMYIRIIFLVLLFGFGTGLIAYIILWIITPTANSLTDKMQMKGEPVTLSNIDSNIKRSKEPTFGTKDEGTFTKVLLFPFRLVGKIFSGLGRAFAPLLLFIVAFIRVVTGLIISTTALSIIISILAVGGVLFGLYNGDWWMWDNDLAYLPIEVFRATVPGIGILFLIVALFIPFLYLLIAGITVIAKRRVMSSAVGWSILGFWFIALLGAAATLPNFIRDFRAEGVYRVTENISINADTLSIGINQINYGVFSNNSRWIQVNRDFDNGYSSDFTDLDIMLSEDDQFRVEKRFRSRGRDFEDAERNAQNLEYNYKVEGNEIKFDSELTFPSGAQFRAQEVDVTFFIPEGQPFKVERGMGNLLNYFNYTYSWWEIYNNTWMYVDGSLKCITCEESDNDNSDASANIIRIELEAFNTIKISDKFKVFVKQGDSNSLEIEGPENKISRVNLNINEGVLNLSGRDFSIKEDDTDEFTLYITTQKLTDITLYEEVEINISDFNIDQLNLNIHDKAKASLNSSIQYLSFFLMDNSQLNLENDIQKVVAILREDSRLYAYDAIIDVVQIDANDDSRARLNVAKELFVTAEGRSSIKYKGNPRLDIKNQSSAASVSKY
jgi:phage shock protein PspC (stress-responsive transcriptional regulator)